MKIKGYQVEKRVTVSDAKMHINKLIESDTPATILKNGEEKSVLVPYDKYVDMFRLWHKTECDKHNKEADDYFKSKEK